MTKPPSTLPEHSPLPWNVGGIWPIGDKEPGQTHVIYSECLPLAMTTWWNLRPKEEAEANARLIVTAVNAVPLAMELAGEVLNQVQIGVETDWFVLEEKACALRAVLGVKP